MANKTQLDKYVSEYINAFKADLISEDTFTQNYMSNVENRKTEIVYSRTNPDNFVSKCLTLTRDTGNKLYEDILTRHIEINLTAAMHSLLFKDLQQLFEKGFTVVESDSKRVVLKRPETLFESLESDISTLYQEYKETETETQREAYLNLESVNAYVSQREAQALQAALAKKQKLIQEQIEQSL